MEPTPTTDGTHDGALIDPAPQFARVGGDAADLLGTEPYPVVEAAMDAALDAAGAASRHGDVPVGAAVFSAAGVVAAAGNARERDGDPTAHAEILALRAAADVVGSWRLTGHGIAVTLEPCPMCAGAAVASRLSVVVFGAADPKAGAAGSLYNLCTDPRLNHECAVVGGYRAAEAGELLRDFFAQRR